MPILQVLCDNLRTRAGVESRKPVSLKLHFLIWTAKDLLGGFNFMCVSLVDVLIGDTSSCSS
jgi:hypothetical protein